MGEISEFRNEIDYRVLNKIRYIGEYVVYYISNIFN